MTVNLQAPNPANVLAVPGVRLGIAEAGVRKVGRKDLTVILLDEGTAVAGVFTQNRYCAAPVQVCREHLKQVTAGTDTQIRALVINTGNANAGTGAKGLTDARATALALATLLNVKPQQVLPFSTGVIMENLPVDRIVAGMPAALADAQAAHWAKAAEGIMTTDTVPKAFSQQVVLSGQTVTITGISKGAGMIRPNMATMLGFLATDANIDPALLPALATDLANASFNRITIDGDTSTNDSFMVMATRKAAHAVISDWHSADGKACALQCWRLRNNWLTPLCATVRVPPSSSPFGWKVEKQLTNVFWLLMPLRIRPWSKQHFLPVTPTWGAFWRQWVMPAFTTSIKISLVCTWTMCVWCKTVAAILLTKKPTASAS